MKKLLQIVIIFLSFTFFSCEKPIDLILSAQNNQLVVEGYIQQGYPAYVFLTISQGYFDSLDSNILNTISIDNAKVFVEREDGIIHELTYIDKSLLDSLNLSDTIELPFKGLYIDLSYKEDNFSQIDYNYKLTILWNNDTITSTTYIPPKWPIDSLWVKRKDSSDYKCYIWARVDDPDTIGNGAMIYYKRDVGWKPMDPLFIPCAIPFRPDIVLNGENFEAFFARSGRADGEDGVFLPFYAERVSDGEFINKDIVLLRISHIDPRTYKFWRSTETMQNTASNPFSEPMNLFGNINGALGIWGGYGVSYYYIPIVPDTVIYETYNDVKVFEIF